MRRSRGFTLTELMAVLAIIAVLSGILFPVMRGAKSAAKRTAAISNLHQCFVAMQLYAPEENFVRSLPNKPVLEPYLGHQITCDPSDTWRSSCEAPSTPWTVGSFGYLRTVGSNDTDEYWEWYASLPYVPLLVSP